jgi:hypothetical protein
MSGEAARVGVIPLVPQNIDKHAVAALGMKAVNRFFENSIVIHGY